MIPTDAEVLASLEQYIAPGYLPAPPSVDSALRRPAGHRGRTVPVDHPPPPDGRRDGAQPATIANCIDLIVEAAVAHIRTQDTAGRHLRRVLAEELPRLELLHPASHVGLRRIRRALADAQTTEEKGATPE